MDARGGIDRHGLDDRKRLDGGISNFREQQITKRQVLGRHLVGWHQATLKMCPLVGDIGYIQQNLPR